MITIFINKTGMTSGGDNHHLTINDTYSLAFPVLFSFSLLLLGILKKKGKEKLIEWMLHKKNFIYACESYEEAPITIVDAIEFIFFLEKQFIFTR